MALSEVLDAALPGTCFSSFVFTLYWSVADYQSCVSFRCLAMWLSFTHTRHDQQLSFPPEPGFPSLLLDKPDWSSWSRAPPTPQGSPCPSSPGSTPPPIHPQQAPASSSSEKRKHQAQRRKKTKNKGREREKWRETERGGGREWRREGWGKKWRSLPFFLKIKLSFSFFTLLHIFVSRTFCTPTLLILHSLLSLLQLGFCSNFPDVAKLSDLIPTSLSSGTVILLIYPPQNGPSSSTLPPTPEISVCL